MIRPTFVNPGFVTLAAGNFLFFTNLSAFFLLPLHLQALGASDAHLGLVMGLYGAAAIVCQPLVGAWVDRTGPRPFLVGGAALVVAVGLGFALLPDALDLFPLLRVLQGVGYSAYFVANFTALLDLVPPSRRGQAVGVFGISGLTATALGPALGEVLARAYGFPVFFATATGVAGAALVLSARLEPGPPRRPPRPDWLADLVRGVGAAPPLPMILATGFGLGVGVIFTFVPPYAATLGVERIGAFAVGYSVAALVVRVVGGHVVDTTSRRSIILLALGLQVAGTVLLAGLAPLAGRAGLPPTPLLLLAGLVTGVAHGWFYPALTALVIDLAPEHLRGQVVGLFSASMLLGNAAGAIIFGRLAHAAGYAPMFAVLALVLAAAGALGLRLRR